MLNCYNKGCDKQFDPANNTDTSCLFHPGAPVFHDGGKKWSCCNKSSVDFTTFLQIRGCAKGPHNPVKPPPQPKQEKSAEIYNEPVLVRKPVSVSSEPAIRPPVDEEKVALNKQVDSRLLAELDKTTERLKAEAEKAASNAANKSGDRDSEFGGVAMGTACKNSGCRATFTGPQADRQVCYYHPGGPVFHEGMKYWSCCQRKTTEFDNFMAQEGCEQGKHRWTKQADAARDENGGPSAASCRCDHHQGKAGYITLDVFAKLCVPEDCTVEANRVCCSVKLLFAAGQSQFQRDFVLYDKIDPSQSFVNIRPTKVEILLKKTNAANWPSLELV